MTKGNKAVFAIFKTKIDLESSVDKLKLNGFRLSDISILLPQDTGVQELKHTKSTKAPEGAVTGAGTGAVLGLLAGIGLLAIPGVGPLIGAGPIMASLAGVGVGGTVGAVSGALIGIGIPEYEANRYVGYIKEGGILISVHVDDSKWADKAKIILESSGAKDISLTKELKGDEEANSDDTNPYGDKEIRDKNPSSNPPLLY